jgi:hypothetical protein
MISLFLETFSSNKKITMMQIETIILNTSLIHVNEKTIPGELKTETNGASETNYSNSTRTPLCNENRRKTNSKQQPLNLHHGAKFVPYFSSSFDLAKASADRK